MKIKDFLKEFKSNRTITTINVLGYSIALSACLIIGIYVYTQFTFDKFNEKSARIFRVNNVHDKEMINEATTNHQWRDVLTNEMPGIEKAARFGWPSENNIEYNKKDYKATGTHGDKELFDIFSFPVLEKEDNNFLKKPYSIALSQSLSHKIFGNESPIGRLIILNYGEQYTVRAVFKDIPSNSSVYFQFLTSTNDVVEAIAKNNKELKTHWTWWWLRTFVLVKDKTIAAQFGKAMKPLQKKYVGDWYAESRDYYLQPLEKIHLYSSSVNGSNSSDVSIVLVYIFCSAGLLILIISCINYINLSTAAFESRKHSTAIRKIIGASRSWLFRQYLTYSVLLTFLCIGGSIIISMNVIPLLRSHGIEGIDIPFGNPAFWAVIAVFGLLTGILSGLYPSSYISKTVILTNQKTFKSRSWFRNGLITLQFSIAIFLLIAATVIKKQLHESIKGNLGYSYSSLISMSLTENLYNHYDAVANEITKVAGVLATTSCDFELPGYLGNYWGVQPEGATRIDIFHTRVAPNFFEVLKIPVKAKFCEFTVDTAAASDRVVLNETSVNQFGLGEAILGKKYDFANTKVEVAGIVNDFHISSLRDRIKPVQFIITDKNWNNIIRLEKTGAQKTIAGIKRVWEKFETEKPFEYKFVDNLITEQYRKEESILKLFNVFFALAMLISLIGLYGLVQLLLRFRVKEVGIRKVNGARVAEVMKMLNNDFLKWVALAFVITSPLAWFAMHKWLESFAYKTNLSWWVFAAAGALAMLIALLTVSLLSWRAATKNPVESLRYE